MLNGLYIGWCSLMMMETSIDRKVNCSSQIKRSIQKGEHRMRAKKGCGLHISGVKPTCLQELSKIKN